MMFVPLNLSGGVRKQMVNAFLKAALRQSANGDDGDDGDESHLRMQTAAGDGSAENYRDAREAAENYLNLQAAVRGIESDNLAKIAGGK
jgi:hypothetical protein